MRRKRSARIAAVLCLAGAGLSAAKSPVRHLDALTLGVEYAALWRGQTITRAAVMSREVVQLGRVSYAPVEYVQLSVGLGGDRFTVDEYKGRKFDGRYGLIPLVGLSLHTPAFASGALRIGASVEYQRLDCEDGHGYRYSGGIINPEAGLMIHAGRAVDIEAGARGHIIVGQMERTGTNPVTADFSNNENIRGYFRFTLTAPGGAYGQLCFDASPEIGKTIDNGPEEASIGFSIGVLIRQDRKNERIFEKHGKYFPAFDKMKEKEKRMREDLKE